MAGPILYKKGLFVAAPAFDPNSLSPQYFETTERNFNGSTFVNTGVNNADFFQLDYQYIYISLALSDGQPSAQQSFFGGAGSNPAGTGAFGGIQTSGKLFAYRRASGTTTFTLSNGAVSKSVYKWRFTKASYQVDIYVNGDNKGPVGVSSSVPTDVAIDMYYGAYNGNGTAVQFVTGTGYGFFAWAGASDLSAEDVSNLDNYFAAL